MSTNDTRPLDLTQRPPRSPRCRLGGYALLPRMLDKGRAEIAGKNGEYKFACPLDMQFVDFVGIDPAMLRDQLAAGRGDGEILEWINAHAQHKREDYEILAWTNWQNDRVPSDVEIREFFHSLHKEAAPHRGDIATWADLLDLDDFVSFGGKA